MQVVPAAYLRLAYEIQNRHASACSLFGLACRLGCFAFENPSNSNIAPKPRSTAR
jgi:hypothetical protein